ATKSRGGPTCRSFRSKPQKSFGTSRIQTSRSAEMIPVTIKPGRVDPSVSCNERDKPPGRSIGWHPFVVALLVSERETFGPNSGGITSGVVGRFAFLFVSKQLFVGLHLKH